MSAATLSSLNGSRVNQSSQAWLGTSVHTFFAGFNWDDHPPEIHQITQAVAQGNHEPLSLTMSVGRFFAAINWDGTEAIAAVPASEPPSLPKPSDFTLDEFSDLF